MKQVLLIFLGGGLGSLVRFYLGRLVQSTTTSGFPWGTLTVNVVASFVLGCYVGIEAAKGLPNSYRWLVALGFCGGFSTFSTFSNDTLALFQANRWSEGLLNVFLNVMLCLLATFVGILLAK
jgi:fluoride exporter